MEHWTPVRSVKSQLMECAVDFAVGCRIPTTRASCHITNKKEHLTNFISFKSAVEGISGTTTISGKGDIILNVGTQPPTIVDEQLVIKDSFPTQVVLNNVALVESSPVNLISVSAWTDQFPMHNIMIAQDEIKIFDGEKYLALGKKIGEHRSGNSWYLVATVDKTQTAMTL